MFKILLKVGRFAHSLLYQRGGGGIKHTWHLVLGALLLVLCFWHFTPNPKPPPPFAKAYLALWSWHVGLGTLLLAIGILLLALYPPPPPRATHQEQSANSKNKVPNTLYPLHFTPHPQQSAESSALTPTKLTLTRKNYIGPRRSCAKDLVDISTDLVLHKFRGSVRNWTFFNVLTW